MTYDAIIIGGGAAGLLCAIEAGKRRRRTLVIEHNAQVGRKIVISGGGRCNFTNIHTGPENFVSKNPHFCKSALAGYTPRDFLRLVSKHGIAYYEKKLGQLFCRESSRPIVEMLLQECLRASVEVRTGCTVKQIKKDKDFVVETTLGRFAGGSLIVATGGSSFAKVGATDLGYRIAEQFGIAIEDTRPSLVGLQFAGKTNFSDLAGLSIDAVVTAGKHEFHENILFTHRGLSGPAVLQISNYWEKGKDVSIDLLPDSNAKELLRAGDTQRVELANFLARSLPRRFIERFVPVRVRGTPVDRLTESEIDDIARGLHCWNVQFRDTEGYDRAEVTLGGVSTDELSSKTMEAKKVPGLYFIGEVVDVTGWLGGYNFQWAWASGHAAGKAV